jgi:hypothetical protein
MTSNVVSAPKLIYQADEMPSLGTAVNASTVDILWDSGETILWDDGSEILWDVDVSPDISRHYSQVTLLFPAEAY